MAAEWRRMGLKTIKQTILFLVQICIVSSFNVDTNNSIIFKQEPGSYFGYSVAIHNSARLIVGAPLALNNGKPWGVAHTCDFFLKTCQNVEFVNTEPLVEADEIRNNQWMGATVYSDNTHILACAPRYRTLKLEKKNLQGCCYSVKPLDRSEIWKPCEESVKAVGFCQAGFSAKYTQQSDLILSGFPSIDIETKFAPVGRVALGTSSNSKASLTSGVGIESDGYMGYSVTSGKFSGKDGNIVFVGGTPRSNTLKGRVIMYKDDRAFPVFSSYIDDPSVPEQTGSYFGASLAAADINNDGFTDLLVGAPYYSSDIVNEGAAYVYLNDKQDNLVLAQTLKQAIGTDRKAGGAFATSIGCVGDLNKDGKADIAIGAPWGGTDGKGVVYLYYGQNNDQAPLKLMQIIRPKDFNVDAMGFGYSFAEYYPYDKSGEVLNDVDFNRYPDLAVGAYKSDHAFLFKSRPVISIIGSLSLNGVKKIDLLNKDNICTHEGVMYKCIKDAEACFIVPPQYNNQGELLYTVETDAERTDAKRAFLVSASNQQVNTISKSIPSGTKCDKYTIFIKNATTDIFRDLVIKLSWEFKSTAACKGVCPIANKLISAVDRQRVLFIKGCSEDGNDICSSDLSLSLETKFYPAYSKDLLIAGETKSITMTITIVNKGESAFNNYLHLEYPGKGNNKLVNADDAKVISNDFHGTTIWDADSTKTGDKTTLKVTLSSPITKGSTEKVQIKMSLNAIPKGTTSLKFKAYVTTGSEETNEKDNFKEVEIKASLIAGLSVSSNVVPEQLSWLANMKNAKNRGEPIRFRFLFQNHGPSNADTSKAEIYIPEKFKNHYFFNIIKVDLEGTSKDGSHGNCDTGGVLNPLGIDYTKKSNSTRKRRATGDLGAMNCGSSDTTCRVIVCQFARVSKAQSLTVTVEATFVDATFEEYVKEGRNISIKSQFTSDAVNKPSNPPPDTSFVHFTVNSPYFTKTEGSGTIAWWIILLCILAAIIIIGLIVFVMYKKGFFKRKKHDDEEGEEGALRRGDPGDY